jgi:hypothetical protein
MSGMQAQFRFRSSSRLRIVMLAMAAPAIITIIFSRRRPAGKSEQFLAQPNGWELSSSIAANAHPL